jgi:single-strand DNA-binding protein
MADLRMPDINSVIIVGNLIKDPAFRSTSTGVPVSNFMIASNRKFKDNSGLIKEDVCFIGVVAWYKLAESCRDNLQKGSAVLVEGELQSRNFRTEEGQSRSVIEIKARRIQFLNRRETHFEHDFRHEHDDNTMFDTSSDDEGRPGPKPALEYDGDYNGMSRI